MRFGSRKFIVTMFILIGATAMCAYDKISGNGLVLLYSLGGSGYGLVNYLSKKSGGKDVS